MDSENIVYRKIVERIINKGGTLPVSLSEWKRIYPRPKSHYIAHPKRYFDKFPIICFKSQGDDNFTLELEINFGLCENYSTSDGCKDFMCTSLHCCSHYLQGSCKFNKACKFSHDLKNQHNLKTLQSNRMDFMEAEEILGILKSKNKVDTRPLICKQYNCSSGCKFESECTCLHLCYYYVNDECSYGKKCMRSHDLKDPKIRNVLVKRGVNINQKPAAILQDIRKSLECTQNVKPKRDKSCENRKMSTQLSLVSKKNEIHKTDDNMSDESPLICTFYLRNKCLFKDSCTKFHQPDHLPYHWQYKDDDKWIDLPKNKDIESSYCGCEDNIEITSIDGIPVTLDFDNMEWIVANVVRGKIRRLSTGIQEDASKDFQYLTVWNWYWLKDQEWLIYKAENGYPSSDKIESAFQSDQKAPLQYETKGYSYVLYFHNMIQINLTSGKVRKLRRRPDVFDEKAKKPKSVSILNKTEGIKSMLIDYPEYWSPMPTNDDSYHLVEVLPSGETADEYLKVNKIFQATQNNPIKKLERIQNSELWRFFVIKRDSLKKKKETCATEKYLFHGTKSTYIDAICQQGFDFRLSGTSSGTSYGKGSYFARDAKYSVNYSDCRKMFIARVIVGESVVGLPSYTRPPLRNPAKYDTYESCINSTSNPSIYVIFDNNQAYPEYLIEY